jgi:hypothetical protein
MSVYLSEKSLKTHGPLDFVRDPSRLLSNFWSVTLCVLLSPILAAAFAVFLLFMWTFAIPIAAAGLLYLFFGGRSSRAKV